MHFDNKKQKLFKENVLKEIENSAIEIFDPVYQRSWQFKIKLSKLSPQNEKNTKNMRIKYSRIPNM